MLVLSRKKDECIVINNDITIVVVEIRGDKVRLGVEAPKEVPVHRREVYDAIARGEPLDIHLGSPTPSPPAASNAAADEVSTGRIPGSEDSGPATNDAIS
jgi:carbon storage regulator